MKKVYSGDEKEFEIDGTYRGYYKAMLAASDLIWGFMCNGRCDYIAVESCSDGAITIHEFDLDGNLIDVYPTDEFNSVDEFLNAL
jgi:hypothetical protein